MQVFILKGVDSDNSERILGVFDSIKRLENAIIFHRDIDQDIDTFKTCQCSMYVDKKYGIE